MNVSPPFAARTTVNLSVDLTSSTAGFGVGGDFRLRINGSFFSIIPLTFEANANSANSAVTLLVLADDMGEGDETIVLSLLEYPATTHTITILDDDLTATISGGGATVNEGATADVTITLNGATLTEGVVVTYTGAGAAGSVTIPTGATTATLTLTATDDNIAEDAETITVDATTVTATTAGNITVAGSATLTIAASDSRTLTVTGDRTITDGESGRYTVALTGDPFTSATMVTWTVMHGTTDADDFAAVTGSIMFPTATTFTVATDDADDSEGPETFMLTLSVADLNADGGSVIAPGITVTIAGDDDPVARAERVETPLAVTAGHIGQLAARAVGERLHFDNVNTFNVAPAATAGELLRQTSFSLAHGDGGINFWGGGGYVSTDGEHDGMSYDGDVTAFHLGVDTGWNNGLLGIAISRSDSDMDFNNTDTLETNVTSVHPYLTRKFSNVQLWTTVGYGTGDAELKEPDTVIKTDVTVTTAALGLTVAPTDGVTLRADGAYTRAQLDAAEANNRRLQKVTADNLRINAAVELSGQRDAWRSFLTVNVRHDSGDGDEGTAGDLGGGLEWHSSTATLRLEGSKYLTGSGAEEERINFTARKTSGRLNLGLTVGMDDGVNIANLLSGKLQF